MRMHSHGYLFVLSILLVCTSSLYAQESSQQPDTLLLHPEVVFWEKLSPRLPMSARETRLQHLIEVLSASEDSISSTEFARRAAYIYRLQADMLEAEARGDTVAMETALEQAVNALEQLARHPSVTSNGRFRELYRTIVTEYENFYGTRDSLIAEQGDIFQFREEMFAALDTIDEPLLEDVQLPPLPTLTTTVPLPTNRLVEQSIAYLLRNPDKHVLHWMRRAYTYFPMIDKIFEEEGVPNELKYLAMIESGLNPRARSWARAAGMWQFIAATARHYNLRIDRWVDERLDPEKSTRAAARHLKDLYDIFGDWHLALAGYNFSPGKLKRIVRRIEARLNRKATFWDVYPYIPRETRNYVPMFIATALVVSNAKVFGLPEVTPGPRYEYDYVPITGVLDLQTIAELANTNVATIRALNPELEKWMTPPTDGVYWLRLPLGSYETFYTAYQQLPESARRPVKEYRVRRGDTLGKIASRFGVSLRKLKRVNGIRGSLIRQGQVLIIPLPHSTQPSMAEAQQLKPIRVQYAAGSLRPLIAINAPSSERPVDGKKQIEQIAASARQLAKRVSSSRRASVPRGKKIRYKVKPGDTLSEIAERYGVRISDIQRWNGLRSRRIIRAGKTLTIYARKLPENKVASSENTSKHTKGIRYRVRRGDTLSEIAERFNVSLAQLKAWNNLRSSRIRAGQILVVRQPETNTRRTGGETVYIVKKGDSLYEIARKYGVSIRDLKRWNGLRSSTIKPGQAIKIATAS